MNLMLPLKNTVISIGSIYMYMDVRDHMILFLQTVFRKLNATLGQQMLELSYTSTTNTKIVLGHMSRLQSFLYLQCNVVIPYLAAKLNEQQQKRNFPTRYPTVCRLINQNRTNS